MTVDVIVLGAGGRMGKCLVRAAANTAGILLSGAVEAQGHPAVGQDAGVHAGVGALDCPIGDSLDDLAVEGHVVVDFTVPTATLAYLKCMTAGKAKGVIGTTGFSKEQLASIKKASQETAIVMAPNMSIGMNLLFKLTQDVAHVLGDAYDVEIVEAHHHHKKDAPSGSARRLAEKAAAGLGRNLEKVGVYGRQGIVGERKSEEIGIHAVRAGDIVGDHTVLFGGAGERIELRHQAHSRETFAFGAMRAALWVADKPAGLYDMQDILGLK